jgi:hypothetical protein
MEQQTYNEELIERYLLGDLPDDEQVRLEDRAFSDHVYMQDVLAVEGDLIDEYVRGALPERKRRQFENRFLASHERRQKVEFARALAKVASKPALAETVPQPIVAPARVSWWNSFLAFLRDGNPAMKFSLAAASLLLVAGIPWLLIQTIRLRGELRQLQAERQTQRTRQETLERQAAGAGARAEELTAQLEQERKLREQSEELAHQLEQERDRLSRSQKEPSQSTIASLILLPGISRSESDRPKLVIPQAARLARLQIGLEREDEYQSFRVDLRTAQGQQVWTQDRLRPRQSRAGRILNLTIPGSALSTGRYELTLIGMIDQQKTEDVRYYYFDVLKE